MQVTKEQTSPCEVELKIEVEPERVAQAYDLAYRKFARVTNVPGFRKGKAPRAILEKYVPAESVREEVLDDLVGRSYVEALKQEEIDPYAGPEVKLEDLEEGKPFAFTAKVPLPPEVELGEYKGIEIEKQPVSVSDEDVDSELEYLRQRNATARKVENRGVQESDILIAEVASTVEGEEKAEPKRSLIQLGDNVPGFDENVMGLKPGEQKVFAVEYPADYSDAQLAGKKAQFEVKLEGIRERVIPELNDDFAKTLGQFATVDELKADVRAHIQSSRESEAEREVEHKLIDEVIARAKVCFPEVILEHDLHHELEDIGERLKRQNVTMEQYLAETGKTEEEFLTELREALTRRIKAGLVLGRIAEAAEIDVTDADVDAEIERMITESNATRESVQAYVDAHGGRSALQNTMLNRRILDHLKSVSHVKYGAETSAEST